MNEKQKTLLILTPGFAKDENDTVCIPAQQDFIRTLKKIHPALNIIILTMEYPFFRGVYNWYGNTVISFKGINKDVRKLFLRRRVYSRLNELCKENNVVGLLSFWCGECALIAKRFSDSNNIRHICWIWGQDAKKENKYPKRINPRGDELAAFSDFLQEKFEKDHGIKPKYVVPPGINHNQFSADIYNRDIDILGVGSLIPLKRYDIFIDIIAGIKKQIPGIKAIIIGKGTERDKLAALIEKKELQSNITLTGELPRDEVLSRMQKAKVLIHSSSYEGFSGVCMEALGAGARVISFVKPMHEEIVNWHIAISNEEMIQETIKILQDKKIEYRSMIPYTIEKTVQKMAELFSL